MKIFTTSTRSRQNKDWKP